LDGVAEAAHRSDAVAVVVGAAPRRGGEAGHRLADVATPRPRPAATAPDRTEDWHGSRESIVTYNQKGPLRSVSCFQLYHNFPRMSCVFSLRLAGPTTLKFR
jgi:hypothetical protein